MAAALFLLGGAAVPVRTRSVDPPAGPGAMAPNLVAAGKDLLLTWLEPVDPKDRPKGHRLRFARFSGGRWSTPVTVVQGTDLLGNWADFPGAVEGPDGSLALHWLARKEGGDAHAHAYHAVLARSTDRGATWSRTAVLDGGGPPAEYGFVSWVPEPGGLRAFWLDGRETAKDGPMSLRTAEVGASAAREKVLDGDVCTCCQTDAALAAGGPVVAYRDHAKEEVRDISVIRRTEKGWSDPVRVHADGWKIPGCPVNGPAIAAAGRNVAVAWFTAAPPSPRVQLAFSKDGGATFGPALAVDGEKPLGRVDLALDANGDALVSWLALEGKSGASVRLRRFTPGGKAGAPVTVAATSSARSSGFPRMVRSGGDLYMAWVEDGEPSRIRVAALPAAAVR
jgi:hypothetical protein